jgi:hypothetical protein
MHIAGVVYKDSVATLCFTLSPSGVIDPLDPAVGVLATELNLEVNLIKYALMVLVRTFCFPQVKCIEDNTAPYTLALTTLKTLKR